MFKANVPMNTAVAALALVLIGGLIYWKFQSRRAEGFSDEERAAKTCSRKAINDAVYSYGFSAPHSVR